jgi:HEAT repeat protein
MMCSFPPSSFAVFLGIVFFAAGPCARGQTENPAPVADRVDSLLFEFRKLAPKAKWRQAERVLSDLVALGRPAVPALIETVRNRRPGIPADLRAPGLEWVAHYALQALGTIGDARAVPVLIEVLGDENYHTSKEATEALAKIGVEAVPALMAALKDRREWVVDSAARALGEIRDASAVKSLLAALGKRPKARPGIVTALGQLRTRAAIEPLLALLKEPKLEVAYEAIQALGRIGARDGEYRLTVAVAGFLTSPDRRIRSAAAEALGRIGSPRAVEPLLAALRAWKPAANLPGGDGLPAPDLFPQTVVQALADLGADAVPPLLLALSDKKETAREGVIVALGKLGDVRAVDRLIRLLRGEEVLLQSTVALALGEIGHVRAIPPLLETLRERTLFPQDGAKALAKFGRRALPALLEALKDDSVRVRVAAAEALAVIGGPDVQEPLLAAWSEPRNRSTTVGTYAHQGLLKVADARVLRPLLALLTDADRWNRARAAEVLGRINDPRAVPHLIAALRDGDKEVRLSAVTALRAIGDNHAVEPLVAALNDPAAPVRVEVIAALGDLGDARAVAPLIAALKDHNLWTPLGDALGKIGEPAVGLLAAALHDKDYFLRAGAAEALGKTGSRRAALLLIKALGDEEWWVRLRAAYSLGDIGDARAVPPLLAMHQDRAAHQARQALWLIGLPGVQPLCDALKDRDHGVRFQAAMTLGEIADRRAVEPLLAVLHDADKAVRRQAVLALGAIGDARARKGLQSLLEREQDQEVRETAVRVLKVVPLN